MVCEDLGDCALAKKKKKINICSEKFFYYVHLGNTHSLS